MSIFSKNIEEIINGLCNTMNFTRGQLAEALGINSELIQDWIDDKKFPSPEEFRGLYRCINNYSGMSYVKMILSNLLTQPLYLITPLHNDLEGFRKNGDCHDLNDYLKLPLLDAFMGQTRSLDLEQFERLVVEAVRVQRGL